MLHHWELFLLVILGRKAKNRVEIIDGLNPNDVIIEDGNRMVKNNQIVKIEYQMKNSNKWKKHQN